MLPPDRNVKHCDERITAQLPWRKDAFLHRYNCTGFSEKRVIYRSNTNKVVFVHQGRAIRPCAHKDWSDSISLAMHASAAAKAVRELPL